MTDDPLPALRAICLAFPETTEKPTGAHAAFQVRDKTFAWFWDNHHGDGQVALTCKTPSGVQDILVTADPARYFVPPYVGGRGWIGLRLDVPIDWDDVADLITDSYRLTAPKRLVALLDQKGGEGVAP